jgi:hypothetical protein
VARAHPVPPETGEGYRLVHARGGSGVAAVLERKSVTAPSGFAIYHSLRFGYYVPKIPKTRNLGENWKVRLPMERKGVSKIYIPEGLWCMKN